METQKSEQTAQANTGGQAVTASTADATPVAGPTSTLAQEGGAASIVAANTIGGTAASPAEAVRSTATAPITTSEEKAAPLAALWKVVQEHKHSEIWNVTIENPASHVPSQIVLQKYLNANDGDLTKATEQLTSTLDYRAKTDVVNSVPKHYSRERFAGLGYITSYSNGTETPETREVFTWNIYGGVKDIQKSFGDLDAFIDWRVALMELAMQELDLSRAKTPITAQDDPYKIYQVHDYKSVSFLRSPPEVRGAAKKTVEVIAMAYPETLKEKFFVNVPAIMGFMYGITKMFVAPKTIRKFHPMSNGGALHLEFAHSKVQGLGSKLPSEYGGKGEALSSAGKELSLE